MSFFFAYSIILSFFPAKIDIKDTTSLNVVIFFFFFENPRNYPF